MARIATRAVRTVAVAALAMLALVPAATGSSSTVEITGFVALFHPSEYTTVYRVGARGKNLTYKWTKVQAGKACGLFTTGGGEAKWRHPHKSQMDPEVPADRWCEDAQQTGGHRGTITVVVSDATSSCTQTWPFGSLSSQEVKEAGGQVPKPVCKSKTSSSTTTTPLAPDLQVRVVGPKSWPVKVYPRGYGNLLGEYREVDRLRYLVTVTNDGPGQVEKPFLTISFFDGRGRPIAWVPNYGLSLWDCEPGFADETHRITCRYGRYGGAPMRPKETVELKINISSVGIDKSPVLKQFTKRGLVVKASVGTSTKERTKANNDAKQATSFVAIVV